MANPWKVYSLTNFLIIRKIKANAIESHSYADFFFKKKVRCLGTAWAGGQQDPEAGELRAWRAKGYVSLEFHVWYEYYSQYCPPRWRFLFCLLRKAAHRFNDRKRLTWWNGPEVPNNTSPCPKTPQHLLCSSPIHLLCVPSLRFSLHLSSLPFPKRCTICPSQAAIPLTYSTPSPRACASHGPPGKFGDCH